jgi:hypothetical protein
VPGKSGYYTAYWDLEPLNVAGMKQLKEAVAKDDNYQYWSDAE